MASFTAVVERKRKRRRKNAGHARKLRMARHSTLSCEELFSACGKPGQRAPAPAPARAPDRPPTAR